MIKAGGIDLLDLMKENIVSPSKLVNIRNIDSLRGIAAALDGLYLGFLSTLMGSTTTYRCLKTMSRAGSDEHHVHRSIFLEGRSCWEGSEQ